MSGSLGFALVPTLRVDRTVVSLPVEVGVLFRAPRGLVSDGEMVQVDGAWLGAALRVAIGWGRREPRPTVGAPP